MQSGDIEVPDIVFVATVRDENVGPVDFVFQQVECTASGAPCYQRQVVRSQSPIRNRIYNAQGDILIHVLEGDRVVNSFWGQENHYGEYEDQYRSRGLTLRKAKKWSGNGEWIVETRPQDTPSWEWANNEFPSYLDAVIVGGQEIDILDQNIMILKP